MNIDETKSADIVRRLTAISNERTKTESEELGFNTKEYENMQEFFNKEIKNKDVKDILKIINRLLKDVRNPKLRKYFLDFMSKHVRFLND